MRNTWRRACWWWLRRRSWMTSEMVIVTLARRLFFRSERREMARFTVVLSFDVLNFRPRRASSFLPMAFSFFCLVFWEENYVQFGNRKKMLNIQSRRIKDNQQKTNLTLPIYDQERDPWVLVKMFWLGLLLLQLDPFWLWK